MSEKKLDLPYIIYIPYSVQNDESIPDSVKIYFGQIAALSVKFGYCYASDEQLAEMKKVSVKNIERWNMLLEKAGHITRETYNDFVKDRSCKQRFKKKRRIYIANAFVSKEVSEPLKIEGSEEPLKIEGSEEPLKIEGYKSKPLKKKEKNKPMNVVVAPESLDELDIPETLKVSLAKKYTVAEIDLAVKRTLKWKNRPSDVLGIQTTLRDRATWSDSDTSFETQNSNNELLDKFRYLDMKTFDGIRVIIGPDYIEFIAGQKVTRYDTKLAGFKNSMMSKLKELNILQ